MDILFGSKKLKKELSEEKAMTKAHGQKRAKRLKVVMTTRGSV